MAVRLDMDALESAAGQVSSISSNFTTELNSLGALVQSSKEYWDDPAQVSFEAKYNEFRISMTNFIEALNHYSTAMKTYADQQRSMVDTGAKMFNSI